jgi:hypothetical protein
MALIVLLAVVVNRTRRGGLIVCGAGLAARGLAGATNDNGMVRRSITR